MSSPVAIIFGAGPNVGYHAAKAFAAKGYQVAVVSRKASSSRGSPNIVDFAGDLSDPYVVPKIFAEVKQKLGTPSVVVYNSAAFTKGQPDPLDIPLADFIRNLNINISSAFTAVQEATQAFTGLDASASKTFIYTGNCLNKKTIPPLMDNGMGKSAIAHMIEFAVANSSYKEKGYKFYYADERTPEGKPVYMKIDGEAHGEHYVSLSEEKEQGPWQQTFVKGIGYKHFHAFSI